ncbi:MAG: integrase, partial [Gammaproteobacteria bacterium]|nr:integrase [Gammaproteobacteria bacterium]
MKLKDTMLRRVKPAAKTLKLFDGGGLYLQITPQGGKRWRLKYYFENKEKCLSLGTYPEVSLKEARCQRDEMRKLLARGIDPSTQRQAMKASRADQEANSFEGIAQEWVTRCQSTWTPKHCTLTLRRLERDVFPWLGRLPIAEISASQLLTTLRRVEERGAHETAHRLLSVCGQVFRYAIVTCRAERDIAADLRGALAAVKKKHFAAVVEPKEAGTLLRMIDSYQGSFIVACALKLAPLVFVRPGELR